MKQKKSWLADFLALKPLTYISYVITSAAIFSFLLDLTMVFSIYLNPYMFGIILIYIVLLPAISTINNARTFFAVFLVPILGSWAISVYYLSSFGLPVLPLSVIVSAIPVALTIPSHLLTRMRNMVLNKPMASLGRLSFGLASTIFFLIAPIVLTPTHIDLSPVYIVALFSMLQVGYVLSSLHIVNASYRYRILCGKLNVSSIERKEREVWRTIEDKFSSQQKDLDLLRYYSAGAIDSFKEGAYEESFNSGYQTIREKTIVDPKDYVSDKRNGKPESFSEIRTILMHSRRKETQIDVDKIKETKKELPYYCVELLQRDFEFLEILSRDLNGMNKGTSSS